MWAACSGDSLDKKAQKPAFRLLALTLAGMSINPVAVAFLHQYQKKNFFGIPM